MENEEIQSAFVDIPDNEFPFALEYVGADDETIWYVMVTEPGAIKVPPMSGVVKVRVWHKDGVDERPV